MTGLLVSVRSAEEARAADRGGAAVIDIKDPARGALGAAEPGTWLQIQAAVPTARLSVALGELVDGCPYAPAPELGVAQWAKVGLAGATRLADWRRSLAATFARFPETTAAIAVCYADWQRAAAPPPAAVIEASQALGCAGVLFDTYGKDGTTLYDWLCDAQLEDWIRAARRCSIRVVLAGMLGEAHVPRVVALQPDFLGVRSAVCRGDRQTAVCEQLVLALSSRINAESKRAARNLQTMSADA